MVCTGVGPRRPNNASGCHGAVQQAPGMAHHGQPAEQIAADGGWHWLPRLAPLLRRRVMRLEPRRSGALAAPSSQRPSTAPIEKRRPNEACRKVGSARRTTCGDAANSGQRDRPSISHGGRHLGHGAEHGAEHPEKTDRQSQQQLTLFKPITSLLSVSEPPPPPQPYLSLHVDKVMLINCVAFGSGAARVLSNIYVFHSAVQNCPDAPAGRPGRPGRATGSSTRWIPHWPHRRGSEFAPGYARPAGPTPTARPARPARLLPHLNHQFTHFNFSYSFR